MKYFVRIFGIVLLMSTFALAQSGDSEETLLEQEKARAREQVQSVIPTVPVSFPMEDVSHPLFIGVDDVTVPSYVGDLASNWLQAFIGVEVWGAAYDVNNNKVYFNDGSTLYEWLVGDTIVNMLGTITDTSGATYTMVALAFYNDVLYGTRNGAPEGVHIINTTTYVATMFIDYEDADYDFGGLSIDPNTGDIYGTSDDSTPARGLYLINPDATATLIAPYPDAQTDIDGLAVSEDGFAYLVIDEPGNIYVYDFVGGAYVTPLTNPWTSSEVFCGGAWIYEAGSDCNLFEDTFDSDIAQWTEVGGLGTANWFWGAGNQAGGAAPGELTFAWTPQFLGDSYLMSPVIPSASYTGTISFEHYLNWFGGAGTVGFAYTTDGGSTWASIWEVVDPAGNIGPENVTVPFTGDANLQIAFYWSGDSYNINFWHIDDVCIYGLIPVELTSFTASVDGRNVTLNWATATETNNQGFEIERNSGNGFEKVDYVAGSGTSTEPRSYSFIDASLNEGTYSYRLKQLDFDGTFEYSDAIEVEVAIPDVFALEQNYPNPFNPSTKIDFSLAVNSKVGLKVFDVLGQEVATLVNTDLVAGSHNVDFNAASINSGVYFYRIDATGIDGTNYTSVKKMILLK